MSSLEQFDEMVPTLAGQQLIGRDRGNMGVEGQNEPRRAGS